VVSPIVVFLEVGIDRLRFQTGVTGEPGNTCGGDQRNGSSEGGDRRAECMKAQVAGGGGIPTPERSGFREGCLSQALRMVVG